MNRKIWEKSKAADWIVIYTEVFSFHAQHVWIRFHAFILLIYMCIQYSPKKVHTIHYISHTHFYINRNNVAICGANGHGGLQSFVYCSQFFLYLFIHHCNAQQAVNVKNIVVSKWHNIHKHTHHYLI